MGAGRNQAGTAVVGEVAPDPLQEDENAVSETDKENEVDEYPGKPRWETVESNSLNICHRRVPSNGGHRPAVAVEE